MGGPVPGATPVQPTPMQRPPQVMFSPENLLAMHLAGGVQSPFLQAAMLMGAGGLPWRTLPVPMPLPQPRPLPVRKQPMPVPMPLPQPRPLPPAPAPPAPPVAPPRSVFPVYERSPADVEVR